MSTSVPNLGLVRKQFSKTLTGMRSKAGMWVGNEVVGSLGQKSETEILGIGIVGRDWGGGSCD